MLLLKGNIIFLILKQDYFMNFPFYESHYIYNMLSFSIFISFFYYTGT